MPVVLLLNGAKSWDRVKFFVGQEDRVRAFVHSKTSEIVEAKLEQMRTRLESGYELQ